MSDDWWVFKQVNISFCTISSQWLLKNKECGARDRQQERREESKGELVLHVPSTDGCVK